MKLFTEIKGLLVSSAAFVGCVSVKQLSPSYLIPVNIIYLLTKLLVLTGVIKGREPFFSQLSKQTELHYITTKVFSGGEV